MKIKEEKGAITLFVLVSILLFIATLVSVYIFVQGKNRAIKNNLKQIESQYQVDDNSLSDIYNANSGFTPKISLEKIDDRCIKGSIDLSNDNSNYIDKININSLKYGWYFSETMLDFNTELGVNNIGEENIEWHIPERGKNEENKLKLDIVKSTDRYGYYYLCLMVNNMEFWQYIKAGIIIYAKEVEFIPEDSSWENITNVQEATDWLYNNLIIKEAQD